MSCQSQRHLKARVLLSLQQAFDFDYSRLGRVILALANESLAKDAWDVGYLVFEKLRANLILIVVDQHGKVFGVNLGADPSQGHRCCRKLPLFESVELLLDDLCWLGDYDGSSFGALDSHYLVLASLNFNLVRRAWFG